MRAWSVSFVVALLLSGVSSMADGFDRLGNDPYASRSEIIAPHAMAATSQPLATQVALDILKAGGNAVDAAIAANAMLGLMEPTGSGIGGDLFAMVWDADTGRLLGLNGSGRSPAALELEYFTARGMQEIPERGPLPVSVPGAVDAWFSLHQRLGKLPMAQILAPAIAYARDGFPVSEVIAYYWEQNAGELKDFEGFAPVFMPGGRAPRKGELFRNPQLAKTYERLAREGRDAFYLGDMASVMAGYMKKQGGFLSEQDLAAHHSEWVEPVYADYRGFRVWELPPNGQGIAALQILKILEGFDLAAAGFGSAEHLHLLIEAKKLAFEDRARFYADPDFYATPVHALLSDEYAKQRRGLIDLEQAAMTASHGDPQALEAGDTIYLTVADAHGNMVSLIQSNYSGMGSGMTPPGLGFILQNRGQLFSLEPGHPNVFAPGKRPFHTIIPAFVTRAGKPWLSFGVMGGAMQPQGHAQILVNLIDFGMNLQQAGDAPRMRHDGSSEPTGGSLQGGGLVMLESGFSPATWKELERRGHTLAKAEGGYGGYQAIAVDPATGVYTGASESRKDGQAAGY
jgi:gamma-glutamyltranspeptidase/glutathione hydrolase